MEEIPIQRQIRVPPAHYPELSYYIHFGPSPSLNLSRRSTPGSAEFLGPHQRLLVLLKELVQALNPIGLKLDCISMLVDYIAVSRECICTQSNRIAQSVNNE